MHKQYKRRLVWKQIHVSNYINTICYNEHLKTKQTDAFGLHLKHRNTKSDLAYIRQLLISYKYL